MHRNRRAKIVATVGPASASPDMLETLFLAGVDTFRLNFSHGTHDDHAKVHAAIRALEEKTGRPIGILMDLQGPKIRVGTVRDGKMSVATGETIRFILQGADGDKDAIPLPHPEIFAAIAPSHDLLIDDGRRVARDRYRRRLHRGQRHCRRHDFEPQGRQSSRHRARRLAADQEGPRRSRIRPRSSVSTGWHSPSCKSRRT